MSSGRVIILILKQVHADLPMNLSRALSNCWIYQMLDDLKQALILHFLNWSNLFRNSGITPLQSAMKVKHEEDLTEYTVA